MIISLIAILTINCVIGREKTIPWYFSVDNCWFKYHTFNKPIIMGSRTFESIDRRPLIGSRLNIVLSNRLSNIRLKNFIFVNTPERALSLVKGYDEVMVVGGGDIYRVFLTVATRMYLTYINSVYLYGDVWFPSYLFKDWQCIFNIDRRYRTKENNYYDLSFKILERKKRGYSLYYLNT